MYRKVKVCCMIVCTAQLQSAVPGPGSWSPSPLSSHGLGWPPATTSEIAAFDCMIMIRYFVRIGIESYLHRPLTQLHYPCVGVKSASVLIVSPGPEGILRGCCNMNMSGHESEVTGGGNKREDKFVTEYFW